MKARPTIELRNQPVLYKQIQKEAVSLPHAECWSKLFFKFPFHVSGYILKHQAGLLFSVEKCLNAFVFILYAVSIKTTL